MKKHLVTLVALVSASILGVAPAALAAGVPTSDVAWSVAPAVSVVGEERVNVVHELEPGETIVDAVVVTNAGADELHLDVVAADALTSGDGRLELATEEQGSRDVGTWIAPGAGTLSIPAGESVRMPFTITVPNDAIPGDHAGALLTIRRAAAAEGVSVDMRYATRVTVRVPGELRPQMSAGGLGIDVQTGFWPWEQGKATIRYEIGNEGNTALRATQFAAIESIAGLSRAEILSAPDGVTGLRDISELLPGSRIDVVAELPLETSALPLWSARVELAPGIVRAGAADDSSRAALERITVQGETWAWAPGWWVLLGGAVLIVVAAVLNIRLIRRSSTARD